MTTSPTSSTHPISDDAFSGTRVASSVTTAPDHRERHGAEHDQREARAAELRQQHGEHRQQAEAEDGAEIAEGLLLAPGTVRRARARSLPAARRPPGAVSTSRTTDPRSRSS